MEKIYSSMAEELVRVVMYQARAGTMQWDSELPQAKPSILTLGLPPNDEPQDGEPISTLAAGFVPKEFPKGEPKFWVCLANCASWTTGLLVRTGGEPQKKPVWLLMSKSPSGSSLFNIISRISGTQSPLHIGKMLFGLGPILLMLSMKQGTLVARRGWGQMSSALGIDWLSICQNLDFLSDRHSWYSWPMVLSVIGLCSITTVSRYSSSEGARLAGSSHKSPDRS